MRTELKRDKKMPRKIIKILKRIIPVCQDLTVDEQAWVTSACLRLLVMKIDGSWPVR